MVSVTRGGSDRTAAQSIGRRRVTGSQEPVYLHGATNERVAICPADFVLCDDDGGIIIPQVKVMPVLEAAEELTRKEILIRRNIAEGMTLQQALAKYGHV
jgi:4-hydroxy-4-methyl-2-oxoglutarate aldolase